ncbi:DegQ family serine endoprotease [Thioalkalivibrio sulfidiphilus]|uniref:Probable periplasmic serine endoprotease DegP-like n=1 Tax=Thioalkalivibrio sulfidiphilus (strain HL-EbGR7) TaxID=396588 RepID=B8GPK6_THISH|nr:DegQ family serine endoprotease [Thioalkalivibrio sulfidiphilus]ACL72173.1 protease Do [Thioalkalivibrio sulfidiphilus HL-EbGr7]
MMVFSRSTLPFALLFLTLVFSAAAQGRAALPDFVPLVEDNSPAVVNISTTRNIARGGREPPQLRIPDMPDDGVLGDLLRRFFGEGGQMPEQFDTSSLGSGFIISRDGYVVTNHHVIEDADEIIVRLSDRRSFPATVVGSDPKSDVALLKIEASDLPTLKLGNSEQLKVGEWVLAIGSPFGFDHSVTAGIVSAKGRSLPTENYVPFIQTDVAINPGNSGGPLFNMKGEVVGINSQIYSRTGGFMGLSFAIPIEMAMEVVEQLKTQGYVSRGWLGVLIQEVTRELADSFGMSRPTGALVARVLPDSPAEKAGVRVGDVILTFNGEEVTRSSALPPLVGRAPVGKDARVEILRDGRKQTLRIRIAELPPDDELASRAPAESVAPSAAENRFGMTLEPVPAELREALDLEQGGVLVAGVGEGAARDARIQRGDVLVMINNQRIESPAHFAELAGKLTPGSRVPVLVQRPQGPVFLALKVPD